MTNRITTPPEARTVIVGVDTHKHVHVAVAIDSWGIRLGDHAFVVDSGGYGTLEEDGPGTWEALLPPCRRGTGKATGQGRPEPRPTGGRESEGCIRARTSGNGLAPGPGRAKAARGGVSVRRDP